MTGTAAYKRRRRKRVHNKADEEPLAAAEEAYTAAEDAPFEAEETPSTEDKTDVSVHEIPHITGKPRINDARIRSVREHSLKTTPKLRK